MSASAITIGQDLAHYRILGQLGSGGMGEVWEAEDSNLKRRVALKLLPADLDSDPERLKRFQREAETLAALNHPNIVTIHSVEEADGIRFLTMELVEGETLDAVIPERGMPVDDFLDVAVPLADAVAAAHQRGITHRDLKPANVMVTAEGRVKVLDFGLAKPAPLSVEGETALPTATMTAEGRILGTVAYMSPEQAAGKPVSCRSDVFSLGILFYEMTTGQRPFEGETNLEILSSILRSTPQTVTKLSPGLPWRLGRVIGRCLEKDEERRYSSAVGIHEELEALRREAVSGARMRSVLRPGIATVRRLMGKWAALGTLAVIALIAGLWLTRHREAPPETAAEKVSRSTSSPRRKMIVVLPFENLGQPEDEYFAAGMTEEMTSRLAAISGLGVISRNSANQYAKTSKSTKQIGEELGVDYLLGGTVRWSPQPGGSARVRITQQLVRVSDDTHLWAETFDRQLEDIFEVQSEIATMVVDKLGVTLLEPERGAVEATPTENMEAYRAFLRALYHGSEPDWLIEETAQSRLEHLERAIELDPEFAHAWSALAMTHDQFYGLGHDRSEERKEAARRATERAVELAPDPSRAHYIRGVYLYWVEANYDRALEEFRNAEEGIQNDPSLKSWRGFISRRRGDFVEAARILQNVLLLDPKNARVAHQLGDTYRYLRQYPEALPYYELSISIAPGQAVAYRLKAQLHWAWNGNTPAARAALEAGPEAAEVSEFAHDWFWQLIYEDRPRSALAVLASSRGEWLGKPVYYRPKSLLAGYAHQLVGDIETARTAYASAAVQLEAELVRQPNNEKLHSALGITYAALGRNQEAIRAGLRGVEIMPLPEQPFFGLVHVEDLAWIYTLVGNREAALDQLEILLSRPSHISVPLLRLDPRWDALREHPRFRQLLAEYG